jgi:hypothetical protein
LLVVATLSAPATAQNLLYEASGPPTSLSDSLALCGDLNGDGHPEFLAGAPLDSSSALNAGMVRVHSGASGFAFQAFYGAEAHDQLGKVVDGAGDVDADGFPDVIAGCDKIGNLLRVWSGATGALLYDLTAAEPDSLGYAISGLGDFNADGYADFAAATSQIYTSGAGLVAVYSGSDGLVLAQYGSACSAASTEYGISIDGLGDIGGDGDIDLGILELAPQCGSLLHVVSAVGSAFSIAVPDPASPLNTGSLASAGDVNGDGFPDVALGLPGLPTCFGSSPGNVRVYSGQSGAELLSIDGEAGCNWLGWSVAGVGDWNGDGKGDLACGVVGPDRIDVYSGADESLLALFPAPAGGLFGYGVADLGDVNGDGFRDLGGSGVTSGAWVMSECPGVVTELGAGCAGTGPAVPKLSASGCPNPGQTMVQHLTKGFGGQPAFLAFGTSPGLLSLGGGCQLLIGAPVSVASVGPLYNFGPGVGYRDVPILVPPGSSGATVYFQSANLDPLAAVGFAVTNSVRVDIL